jgi:CheY-like chemotaxis protein
MHGDNIVVVYRRITKESVYMPAVVADDEPDVRSLVKTVLTSHGLTVLEAEDGQVALDIIRNLNGQVSLLVSDIRMPRLDGAKLTLAVKERYPSLPVLLISGDCDSDQSELGDTLLLKPVTFAQLLAAVERLRATSVAAMGS